MIKYNTIITKQEIKKYRNCCFLNHSIMIALSNFCVVSPSLSPFTPSTRPTKTKTNYIIVLLHINMLLIHRRAIYLKKKKTKYLFFYSYYMFIIANCNCSCVCVCVFCVYVCVCKQCLII